MPEPTVGTIASVETEVVKAPVVPEMHPVGTLPAFQSLLYIIVVALFLMTFAVQPFRIPSESMEPTLLVGDFLLVNKQAVSGDAHWWMPSSEVHRRDVIVFHDPVDPAIHLVKRVIGMPGDRLHLREGRVYIGGRRLDEAYAQYLPSPPDEFRDEFPRMDSADPEVDAAWWVRLRGLVKDGDLVVPPGSYFVMGDNRNDSEDSRYWGFVPRSAVVGKAMIVYFSLREQSRDEDDPDVPPAAGTKRRAWEFARWGRMLRIVR